MALIGVERPTQVGKRNHGKGNRQNGNEKRISDGNGDGTADHKKQSRCGKRNRKLLPFSRLLQRRADVLHGNRDAAGFLLAPCVQRLLPQRLSPLKQSRKVTGQLLRRQSQHQHDADRQGEKTDNINGTHAPPPFINRCNVSCGTPPRMSLAQSDGDGVFSLQNSPSMRNAPSAKRLSVMWYLYSVR